MNDTRWRAWKFGDFVLDEHERRLSRGERPLALSPKAFDLLVLLVERSGRLARREELMTLLWPGGFVEDGTLARHVSDIRKALGDAAGMLQTVPKAGYRFCAEIEELPPSPAPASALVARRPDRSRIAALLGLAVALVAVPSWLLRPESEPSPAAEAHAASAPRAIDPEARELYLRARFFWSKRTITGQRSAVELFEAALRRDPGYAEAEAGLAAALVLLAGNPEPPALYEQARRHAERALELDAGSAEARSVLGLVAQNYDADWARAEREYRRALELDPDHLTTLHWYGEMLALLGRFEEGIALLERAAKLDPVSLAIASDLAKACYFARRWDQAITHGEGVLAMDNQFAWAWAWVGAAELERGNTARALECLTRFQELDDSAFSAGLRAFALVAAGERASAAEVLEQLENTARTGYVMPTALAMARLALGDEPGAIDAFEQALATRQNRLGWSTAPLFDRLHDQPRFLALLKRAHLEPPSPPPG